MKDLFLRTLKHSLFVRSRWTLYIGKRLINRRRIDREGDILRRGVIEIRTEGTFNAGLNVK